MRPPHKTAAGGHSVVDQSGGAEVVSAKTITSPLIEGALLPVAPLAGRKLVALCAMGLNYLGASDVVAGTGFPLLDGEFLCLHLADDAAVYSIGVGIAQMRSLEVK